VYVRKVEIMQAWLCNYAYTLIDYLCHWISGCSVSITYYHWGNSFL